MKLICLTPQERTLLLATHKVIFGYADVAAMASTGAAVAIFPQSGTFPAGTTARFAGLNLTTAFDFSDAAINSCTITVGDGGDADRLLTSTQLAVDGSEVLFKVEAATTQPYSYVAADTIDATILVGGGGSPLASECTAGVVELYLHITDLNDLERPQ